MGNKGEVYIIATTDRREGVKRCFQYLGELPYAEKKIFLKPNYNTADPTPGSTHNETLEQILTELQSFKPAHMAFGDRCGPAIMAEVIQEKGLDDIAKQFQVDLVNFEEMPQEDWIPVKDERFHWPDHQIHLPRAVQDADVVVSTCTLKTHGFGGVFSMSLKLGVGIVPKDFKTLHHSEHMRKMIAEINLAYEPDFTVMDGIDAFTDGGPMKGNLVKGNVMMVSRDRIALDAVGIAMLRHLGSNEAIMNTPIFEQEQIARAVELNLGVSSIDEIQIVTDDEQSAKLAEKLKKHLH
ncbi:DUF362 domain-containing protein [Alkalibacter rhizosphaerae]|uniref:DUF362 domain-containing protein n=1 Tax=Alkalibacter rhizosphaerae TaxID=2815577 RepID=A0A975AHK1_9FIRM|nr:DUF362 domain-containing protein [Alkalibacter rhizosphaerae]QSX08542.1 DUF362 domain-containing protein [Alkalibacter rhizosphaerae]